MKRIALVLLLAAIFSVIALYFIDPERIEKLWLWFVGLIGVIIAFIQKSGDWIEQQINNIRGNKNDIRVITDTTPPVHLAKIVRYTSSGNKTVGLIYVQRKFLGYSEEETLLPPGNYELTIRKNELVAFEGKSSAKISTPDKAMANDIVIKGNQSNTPGSPELIYNALFEIVAQNIEESKNSILTISYADSLI